jgi:hypothetical protein
MAYASSQRAGQHLAAHDSAGNGRASLTALMAMAENLSLSEIAPELRAKQPKE